VETGPDALRDGDWGWASNTPNTAMQATASNGTQRFRNNSFLLSPAVTGGTTRTPVTRRHRRSICWA